MTPEGTIERAFRKLYFIFRVIVIDRRSYIRFFLEIYLLNTIILEDNLTRDKI